MSRGRQGDNGATCRPQRRDLCVGHPGPCVRRCLHQLFPFGDGVVQLETEGAGGSGARVREQEPKPADVRLQVLRAATQGVGGFEAAFDHYEEVHGKAADRILETRAREPA